MIDRMYQEILGPNEINTNITNAMIWVLPKSGNIFTGIFFRIYSMLLDGITPDDSDFMYGVRTLNLFNKEHFVVGHAEFPGLNKLEKDRKKLDLWNSLYYTKFLRWEPSNQIRASIVSKITEADENFLEHFRVVFVFRNPLDQMLSYHKHFNHLPADEHVTNNSEIYYNFETAVIKEYVHNYLKMFYTSMALL